MSTATLSRPITGAPLYCLLVAFALAAFLVSLDGFIVNVAIPTISGEIGVREDVGTWIITVFTMANTLFVPISGKLAKRFGSRRVFVLGIFVFSLGSSLSGLAYNYTYFLVCRVIQGAGAGLILPVSLTLIIDHFPEEKRSIAVGFWSFFAMVGPAMGPMIGGWLSDYHWHWMFYVNLPLSLGILVTVYAVLGSLLGEKQETEGRVDTVGMLLLLVGMGALQIALNRGQIDDWFRSPFIVGLFILSGCALAYFFVWVRFQSDPIIDLSHFTERNFLLACLCMGGAMSLLFSSFVLDSLWVQEALGYTPAWAGLTLTPVGIFPLVFYPLMGRLAPKLDLRLWVVMSFLLFACTFFWLSRLNSFVSFWQIALPRLIQGIGFPMFTVPMALLAVHGTKKTDLPLVISLFSFFRLMCVALGVPLATTLWIHRTAFYRSRIAEQSYVTNVNFQDLVERFSVVASSKQQALDMSNTFLVGEGSTLALGDVYYAFAWVFVGLCGLTLFYRIQKV